MDWLSTVPLWFWVLQGVLYVLAAVGWAVLMLDRFPRDIWACRFYGAVWPFTAAASLAGTALQAHTRRVNRRKAGWKG